MVYLKKCHMHRNAIKAGLFHTLSSMVAVVIRPLGSNAREPTLTFW